MVQKALRLLVLLVLAASVTGCVLYRDVNEVELEGTSDTQTDTLDTDAAGDTDASTCDADLQTDPDNCGACGTACDAGKVCAAGACAEVRHVTAGSTFACAGLRLDVEQTRSGDEVWCWGENNRGQLGSVNLDGRGPHRVPWPTSPEVDESYVLQDLSAGGRHACAVWLQTTSPHEAVLDCWGANNDRQLGQCEDENIGRYARQLDNPAPPTSAPSRRALYDVSAAGSHTCLLQPNTTTELREVECWGANGVGQASGSNSNGNTDPICPPQQPLPEQQVEVFDVAAGTSHTCAATESSLLCWGPDLENLGQTLDAPKSYAISALESGTQDVFLEVSSGNDFSCFVRGDDSRGAGTFGCFGANLNAADGVLAFSNSEVADWNPAGTVYEHVDAGYAWHAFALDDGGSARGVGRDSSFWSLGVGSDATFEAVSAGSQFTCGITSSEPAGQVICWGVNDSEQLGGPGSSTNTPVPVLFGSEAN